MTPSLIDTHCHLDVEEFNDDREDVIQRAHDTNIAAMLTLATDLPSSQRSIELADSNDSIYAAVGLHPNDARKYRDGMWDELEALAAHPKVIAWGEIGLDYYWDFATKEEQFKILRDQLAIAANLKLPIVVHIRKSAVDTLEVLSEPAFKEVTGILHCWSGTIGQARRGIDMGYLIGIGGSLTFKKSSLPEIAKVLPWESLVVETDSPYLAPVPKRGKRNEPALVRHTFDHLVELKGDRAPEDAARQLWANFRRVFTRFTDDYETVA